MKSVTLKSSDLWIRQPVGWGILDMYLSASSLGLNTTFQINSKVIRKPLKGLQTKYKVNSLVYLLAFMQHYSSLVIKAFIDISVCARKN